MENEAKRLPWEPAPSDPNFWSVLLSHVMGASIRQLASAEKMVREAMEASARGGLVNEADRPKCNCGKWPHEDFCWMKTVSARASESSPPQPELLQEIREKARAVKLAIDTQTYGLFAIEQLCFNALKVGAAATAPSAPPTEIQVGPLKFTKVACPECNNVFPVKVELAAPSAPTATDWMRQAAADLVTGHYNETITEYAKVIAKWYAGEHAGADKEKP